MGVCCHNSLYGKLPDPFSPTGRRHGRVWLHETNHKAGLGTFIGSRASASTYIVCSH